MNTSLKLLALGGACAACCALPAIAVALSGTALASAASAYIGWIAGAGILGAAGFFLLRSRDRAAGASCGCAAPCQASTVGEAEAPPIACTLAPGAYNERVAWIEDLARDALVSARRTDLTLDLTYAPDAAPRVQEMVEREQACCAFLSFALTQDQVGIHLTITAPEEARAAADTLFAHFAAQQLRDRQPSNLNHKDALI